MTPDIPVKPAITYDELRMRVEKYVDVDKMTYSEAIVDICADKQIDPEDIAKIIRGPLKEKLEAEAMERNIIKRTTAYLL